MNKETIFRVTLFNSTYDGDLEPIIKGCKLLAEKNQGVKKTNNHGYQSTDDLHTKIFMDPMIIFMDPTKFFMDSINYFVEKVVAPIWHPYGSTNMNWKAPLK